MKFWLVTSVLAASAALGGFYTTLQLIPIYEMTKAEKRIATIAGGKNVIRHGIRPTSAFKSVVRPSPDQIYSACVYDLSDGPVRFSGSIPDSYWSLSFFAHNSDNFFVVNDDQIQEPYYNYVLIRQGAPAPQDVPVRQLIESPSNTGIALVRMFIDREDNLPELERVRRQGSCQNLADAR